VNIEITDRQMWLTAALKARTNIFAAREKRRKEINEDWEKKSKFSRWFWENNHNYALDYVGLIGCYVEEDAENLAYALRTKGTGIVTISPVKLSRIKEWAEAK
jgi:hypothetical protein